MCMTKKIKVMLAGLLCSMILLTGVTVYAAADAQIKATLLTTAKFKLNGKDYNVKSNSGASLKPIIYNNVVYVPVQAIDKGIGVPVDYDKSTKTVWLGGKTQEIAVDSKSQYEDYTETIITKDSDKLSTPDAQYKWGITNGKTLEMCIFGAYLNPNAKFKKFKASIYMDENVKMPLVMEFRKDKYDGEVIKSITLKPGETTDVDIDISGIQKFCIISNITIGHDKIEKLVIGNPLFSNKTEVSPIIVK